MFEFLKRGNFDTNRFSNNSNTSDNKVNPLDLANIAVIRKNGQGKPDTLKLSVNPNNSENPFIGNFILQPEDMLILPILKSLVFVEGEVNHSGALEWVPNRRAGYYVGIAGRTPDAGDDDKIVIMRKNTNEKIVGQNLIIFPGDHIFVPKRRILVVKEWLDFISPVVSVLIAAKAIGIY